MEMSALNLGLGLVLLVAVGLFLRAMLGGGKMIGGFLDRRDAQRDGAEDAKPGERQRRR